MGVVTRAVPELMTGARLGKKTGGRRIFVTSAREMIRSPEVVKTVTWWERGGGLGKEIP